eukprot:TRINITY_DN3406_c0_g1_i2.p2 TRINITY_DN3406_c0_g1~~TRINITY_DN3406_c0_g1_i2.p2  ORF type:complete len:414 (+),score=131.39 TRINITY_DN3406_c0_g1_i2:120-1361(+)
MLAAQTFAYGDFDWDGCREVGIGAISRIFVAENTTDGRWYAIKRVAKSTLVHMGKAEAAINEKNALKDAQNCAYVGKLHATLQTEEDLLYVMEYFPRGNLEMLTLKQKVDSKAAIAAITAMLVKAVEEVHRAGWVHRDVKPENVCFREDGSIGLVDFDTAVKGEFDPRESKGAVKSIHEQTPSEAQKRYSMDEVNAIRRKSKQFVGTAAYISPEMLDICTWSYCSDLWAVGCCVFQMATGEPAFLAEAQFEVFRKIVRSAIAFDKIEDPDVRSLCEGLLQRDPMQRIGARPGPADANYLAEVKAHPLFAGINWRQVDTSVINSLTPAPSEDEAFIKSLCGDGEESFDLWCAKKNAEKLLPEDDGADHAEDDAGQPTHDDAPFGLLEEDPAKDVPFRPFKFGNDEAECAEDKAS